MLSYQHGYHAGNFADVIKHLTLSRILTYMVKKDKPLLYLETHSGKGLYDLKNSQSIKTGEFENGIDLLWDCQKKLPDVFQAYFKTINELNPDKKLRYYPGSPRLAIDLLRRCDRVYCCELHPKEFESLNRLSKKGLKVHFSKEDGLKALKALLPPVEKRALIFIDPSYEIKDEYKTVPKLIKEAYIKFPTGVYALWYPIVNQGLTEQLHKEMRKINAEDQLIIEFHNEKTIADGMTGCGLWILNQPHSLQAELEIGLKTIENILNPGKSSWTIKTMEYK